MAKPPYGAIWNRWKRGKVIPFLGAGASLVGRTPDKSWSPKARAFLPSGVELAHHLAGQTMVPKEDPRDWDNLAKVCSYYAEVSGRPALRDELREVLNGDYDAGPLHDLIATIPAPQLIIVTNYDDLLERAFRRAGRPYDLVVYPADRKDVAGVLWWKHGAPEPVIEHARDLYIDLTTTTVIYKMHGTIERESGEWDNFVITEEDYIEFLSRMTSNEAVPAIFYQHFKDRSFLFLGYSLQDWNLRVLLTNLGKELAKTGASAGSAHEELPSWAIQLGPSELETTLWQKRQVRIFDLSLDEFVGALREWQES